MTLIPSMVASGSFGIISNRALSLSLGVVYFIVFFPNCGCPPPHPADDVCISELMMETECCG
jgi:hypothetical protein